MRMFCAVALQAIAAAALTAVDNGTAARAFAAVLGWKSALGTILFNLFHIVILSMLKEMGQHPSGRECHGKAAQPYEHGILEAPLFKNDQNGCNAWNKQSHND